MGCKPLAQGHLPATTVANLRGAPLPLEHIRQRPLILAGHPDPQQVPGVVLCLHNEQQYCFALEKWGLPSVWCVHNCTRLQTKYRVAGIRGGILTHIAVDKALPGVTSRAVVQQLQISRLQLPIHA